MTLDKMKTYAAETLTYFIKTMPDVPFTENDIIIEFAPKGQIIETYLKLRAEYAPERIINDSQIKDLADSVFANAIIGREKSVVIVCVDPAMTKSDFIRNMFHEFMHIFCAKTEKSDDFIDIYGPGTTKEVEPFNKEYDGYLAAGYQLWSEFIANYYAVKHTEKRKFTFSYMKENFEDMMWDTTNDNLIQSKGMFAFTCSYLFNCTDVERIIAKLIEDEFIWHEQITYGTESQNAFLACAEHIQEQLKTEKPWEISQEYIAELGLKFIWFRTLNSQYHQIIESLM